MKAILVIDMPKCCEECRLINRHYDNEYGWQTYCGADYHRIREKNKKYFCPLKPIPQKRTLPNWQTIGMPKGNEPWFTEGYNKCIDEILGGMK